MAVKARRPGIGPLIAADLRALDWILILGETLTLISSGATRRFRQDFETILFTSRIPRRSASHRAVQEAVGQAQKGGSQRREFICSTAPKK